MSHCFIYTHTYDICIYTCIYIYTHTSAYVYIYTPTRTVRNTIPHVRCSTLLNLLGFRVSGPRFAVEGDGGVLGSKARLQVSRTPLSPELSNLRKL